MKKIPWPPKALMPKNIKGRVQSQDGSPMWVALRRWDTDRTLRGQLHNACCDCGLDHLLTFEIVREDKGQWWLVKRAYRTSKVGKKHT